MNHLIGDKVSCSSPSRLTRSSPYNQLKTSHATSPKQSNMINAEFPESVTKQVLTNTDDFKIGDRVWVGGIKPGIIAFIGEVHFSQGEWAGVVLDSPVGKNDGSVNGSRYFMCEPRRGIFSTLTKLSKTYLNELSSISEAKNILETNQSQILGDHNNKLKNQKDLKINISLKLMPDATGEKGLQSDTLSRKSLQMESSPVPQSNSNHKSSIGSISSQSSGKVEDFLNNKLDVPFKMGDRVLVSGSKEGIVRFIGQADFARGVWVGVELKKALGKNDGSVAGKRYFQCAAMHGLFAPVHKVEVCRTPVRAPPQQRSQSNLGYSSVSKSNSHNSGFTNRGSQESLSSIGSAASSASRRMKLGVTSLTGHRTKGTFHNTPTLSSFQKTLKEKEEHIEQLIRERDLDRSEFIRTAAQIDEVEAKLILMQSEKKKFMTDMESKMRQAEGLIITLEGEKNDLRIQLVEERRRYEDIQFSLEETNIEKSDIQGQIEKDSRRLKELDGKLKNEMQLNDRLSDEIKSLKMLGLGKDDPVDEYLDQIEELTHKLCVAENKLRVFEKDGGQTSTNSFGIMDEAEKNCHEDVANDDSPSSSDSKVFKNHLKMATQKKLFIESQREELEANLKKVSAEKDLIELELGNLIEDHKRLSSEKDKLMKERMTNHKMISEAGNQIKNFEQKVEKVTCDFAMRMENLRKRAEAAETEAHVLKDEQKSLKGQIHELAMKVKHLTNERDSLVVEIQKIKTPKQENRQESVRSFNDGNNKNGSNNESQDVGNMSIGVGSSLIEKLKSEKDFAESQIDFLNAVIVDLQRKNTNLEQRLKTAESCTTENVSYVDGQKTATVRLFCDICDMFDLHDTDDCPMQNMTSSPLNASLHHGNKNEERPYCSSCEVFGHMTGQCKEQTY